MDYPACTNRFASLATSPFSHARIGDLAAIHRRGINLVLGNRGFSSGAQSALQQLDVQSLAQMHGKPIVDGAKKYGSLGGAEAVRPNQLHGAVGSILERILPPHRGNRAIARDLALMLGDLAVAYNNSALDLSLTANLPGSYGVFHHDNHTEHRWLVTLPTKEARGTWLLDDFARERQIRLDFADPQAGSTKGPAHNHYGRPTALWNHLIREAPVGRMLGWHGEETGTPLIHSEVDVLTPEQSRLTVTATPTHMNRREAARRSAAMAPD